VQRAGLSENAVKAVARGLYKLLAVKDEWEVARLYSKPSFREALAETFDGDMKLTFYFGAWPFGGRDEKTGKMVKGAVSGKKVMFFFGLLNKARFLRGTIFDPFRSTDEAKLARRLLTEYEADIDFAITNWSPEKDEQITSLLDLPEHIRGYGHVRERHANKTSKQRVELRATILKNVLKAA
jgi:indolepyruvate ferredoxin oxidoreductase